MILSPDCGVGGVSQDLNHDHLITAYRHGGLLILRRELHRTHGGLQLIQRDLGFSLRVKQIADPAPVATIWTETDNRVLFRNCR